MSTATLDNIKERTSTEHGKPPTKQYVSLCDA